ncbi:MAG: PAS domain-containing protein [Minwuia sp.]|uniref:PAS domain-containing protein n=1 Tax=Minwuia sp. TaxID=2493630 RepID=UPI003A886B72
MNDAHFRASGTVDGHPVPAGALSFVHGLWLESAVDGGLPGRQDFSPERLLRYLPQIFLIDVEPGGERFRYRLIGTQIAAWSGGDATGRWLDDPKCGPGRFEFIDLVSRVVEGRGPVMTTGKEALFDGSAYLFDRLMLPLASDGAVIDMVLGVANGQPRGPMSSA